MNKRKILALLLAAVMVCSLFVSPAMAAEGEGEPVAISDTVAPKFTDVKDHWAESAINRWAEEGIIEGDGDGTVQPARNLKRAELATILTRLLGLKDKAPANTFSDVAANAWYADAVLKCAQAGIMLGDGTGKANPEASIDRQQAIVMIGRAVGVKPASGDSLDRFQDGDKVADWAAPYMIALTNMDILNGLPVDGGFVVAPNEDINRASTFTLLDKAIAKYVTGPSTVTVDDANKFVVINSAAAEAGTVTVTGTAAGVVIAVGTTDNVVLNNAKVGTLKVDAPVDVTVSRGSSVTDLDANAAAVVTNNGTVTNLNTNADGVTFDGNKPSKVNTAEGVKPATDSKGNEVTDKPASSGGSTTPSVVRADVVAAPLADQAQENAISADKLGTVTVSSRRTDNTDNIPTYEVTVTGRDIMNHTNAKGAVGHWVGFGLPAKVVAEGEAASSYTYEVNGTVVASIADRTYEADGKTYNTVYFSEEADGSYLDYTIVVKDGGTVVANYEVTLDVTFKSDYNVSMMATLPEELLAAYDEAHLPIRHKTAAGLGLTAAVDGNAMTLTGETTIAKLQNTVSGAAGDDGYVLYGLNVGDANIAKIKTGVDTYTLADFEVAGLANGYLMNTKIYDGANKTLLDNTVEIELLDANGRVQGKITQTFNATGCTIEGMKKVTFVDGETTKTVMVAGDTVTAPAVTAESTDSVYYTGKWTVDEVVYAADAEIPATDGMTVTAEKFDITAQAMSLRRNGPEGNTQPGVDNFPYATVYGKAGITLEANNTITVDAAKLLEYQADPENQLNHLLGMSSSTLWVGLEYAAPAGATQYAWAATPEALRREALTALNGDTQSTYDNVLMTYIAFAKLENGEVSFLDDVKDNADNKLESTPYILWANAQGEVVGVTKATLSRETVKKPVVAYTMKMADMTGGKVEADKESYGLGETVTLTVTPNGQTDEELPYIQGTITVKDNKGNAVALTGEGTTRTFTLPENGTVGGEYTVSATFVQPLEVAELFVVNSAATHDKLMGFGYTTTNETYEKNAVQTNPWLAVGLTRADGFDKDDPAYKISNVKLTANGAEVETSWPGAIGKYSSAYIYAADSTDVGNDPDVLGLEGDEFTFTLSFTFQGASYELTCSYTKPAAEPAE